MANMLLTLKEAADMVKGQLIGDGSFLIHNIADLESATPQDASFLANPRYQQQMLRSSAGVILVSKEASPLPEGRNYILVDEPSRAFQILINFFFDAAKSKTAFTGIHPTAVIHPTAILGEGVTVAPYAIIDQGAVIGARTFIAPFVYIGPFSKVGEDCYLHPHTTVREQCVLMNRVILQPGCVIGSCGFGYATSKEGKHLKLEQVGTVIIEDDVEIGANTTIDRSRFKSTRIKQGTKIDNLVQLGHGVVIGEHNLIVAQVGIAGSTETESHVVLGGQVGVAGHLKIGKGAMVAAQSGVSKTLKGGETYGGSPTEPFKEHQRKSVHLRRIETYVQRIEKLEMELSELKTLLKTPT